METLDVSLGGRSYPLTLSPEEVSVVRAAAEAVEAQIAQLKAQYAISDRIDLMAMAALQIAVQAQSGATPRPLPRHPRLTGPRSKSKIFCKGFNPHSMAEPKGPT